MIFGLRNHRSLREAAFESTANPQPAGLTSFTQLQTPMLVTEDELRRGEGLEVGSCWLYKCEQSHKHFLCEAHLFIEG